MISNSRSKLHQTTYKEIFSALYNAGGADTLSHFPCNHTSRGLDSRSLSMQSATGISETALAHKQSYPILELVERRRAAYLTPISSHPLPRRRRLFLPPFLPPLCPSPFSASVSDPRTSTHGAMPRGQHRRARPSLARNDAVARVDGNDEQALPPPPPPLPKETHLG